MPEHIVKAAAYMRLSREDGDGGESNSISVQREIIHDFAGGRGICVVKDYADDGFSGVNFDRPAFRELMTDIREGKINCIIVKDLSRFGRNLVECGRYLEQVFPALGVRFIAINDFFDSDTFGSGSSMSETLSVAFKGLLNEMYCRDISQKIRATLDMKRKSGEFIGNLPPYGYSKDPKAHGRLIVDEKTAGVVRQIFSLKLDGMNNARIASYLNKEGILSPAGRMAECGYKCNFSGSREYKWNHQAVARILGNEIYIGTMVQGKRRKASYKREETVTVPPNDWIRVENKIPPVIDRSTFLYVQDLLKRDTGTAPGATHVYLFSGFVRCGDCGQNMTRVKVCRGGKERVYLVCSENRLRKTCSSNRIREDKVIRAVSAAVFRVLEFLMKALEMIEEQNIIPKRLTAMELLGEELEKARAEILLCQRAEIAAHEDRRTGVLDQEGYLEITEMFAARRKKAQDEIRLLQEKLKNLSEGGDQFIRWLLQLREFTGFTRLTRRMVVIMLENIFIYKGGRIKIVFRYGDRIADLIRLIADGRPDPADR